MPYGVGPSAISQQMIELEEQVGARLFDRQPFRLTPHGRWLQAEIAPFFDRLPGLAERLQQLSTPSIRIAFAGMVAPAFLEVAAAALAAVDPAGQFALMTGRPEDVMASVHEDRVHAVVTLLGVRPRGVRCEVLGRAPLALMVPARSAIAVSGYFWRRGKIDEPLTRGSGVRLLPLPGFDRVTVVALWRSPVGPWLGPLLAALRTTAGRLWPDDSLPLRNRAEKP